MHSFEKAPNTGEVQETTSFSTDYDLSTYYPGDGRDVLDDMIAEHRTKHEAASLFVSTFGRGGSGIVNADNPETVNYMVGTALNPTNLAKLQHINQFRRGESDLQMGEDYGAGVTAQIVGYLQKRPDQIDKVGKHFREKYLKLENAQRDSLKNNTVRELVKTGLIEELIDASASQEQAVRQAGRAIRYYIQPQVKFRQSILSRDLKDSAKDILKMENLLVTDKIRSGTPGAFCRISYEFLRRAAKFQAENPVFSHAAKMENMLCRIQPPDISMPGNFEKLFTFVDALSVMPEYGLNKYRLRNLEIDDPQSWPLAIDRIMRIATTPNVENVAAGSRTLVVRSLGHSARMFAEQAAGKLDEESSLPLLESDIAVRYPGLPLDRCKELFKLISTGESSREVHLYAREILCNLPVNVLK